MVSSLSLLVNYICSKACQLVTIDKWLVTGIVKDRIARGWLPPVFGVSPIFPFSFSFAVSRLCDQGESRRIAAE